MVLYLTIVDAFHLNDTNQKDFLVKIFTKKTSKLDVPTDTPQHYVLQKFLSC